MQEKKMNGPYVVESTQTVYRNRWLSVREDHVTRPDGSPGLFGIVTMLAGSSIIAIDGAGCVLLVREYKYGVGRETLEAISGGIGPGESPLEAAKRELSEEAGVGADEWIPLGVVDPFTTAVVSPNYVFLARGLHAVPRRPDEGEDVLPVSFPLATALEMVINGTITHAASCVGLLRAARILGV